MSVAVVEAPEWPAPKAEIGEKTPVKRLIHFGTVFAFSVITFIGSVSTYFTVMWLPIDTFLGFANLLVFLTWNFVTMTNLYNASVFGPGYIPKQWRPQKAEDEKKLQFCVPCNGFKVPRSHHCSKCNRCCMKMDHHCPWINNCVGHVNHQFFVRFLFFAIIGCIHAAVIDITCMYHGFFAGWYLRYGDGTEPMIWLTPLSFVALVFAIALSMAVAIALTVLLGTQIKYIVKNKTGIEEYIHGKALSMRKVSDEDDEEEKEFIRSLGVWTYPYNLGWKRNVREVWTSLFDGSTKGNGTWWPVREECGQFTFTIEQLLQKQSKRGRARIITIGKDFEGKCCSSRRFGWKIWMKQPIIDGKCLKVSAGETITATRAMSGWVYGFRESAPKDKGWFPIEVTNLRRVGEPEDKTEDTKTEGTESEEDDGDTKKNQ